MSEKVGVAIVGLGGAVATTAVAGIEMIKAGSNDFSGLPLADRDIADMTADDLRESAGRIGATIETAATLTSSPFLRVAGLLAGFRRRWPDS